MAPTLYLNDTDLRTYLLRNGPSPWLCKFTLCFFFLQCSCSYALLWVYCYPHWRSYFSRQLLDGFTETRMTFHWKFQQLRVKIPRFLHEKISNFIIQAFFLFCVHSITRKNLDYKIVLGEYILQFFVNFPWGLHFISECSNLNKIKVKIIKPSTIIPFEQSQHNILWGINPFYFFLYVVCSRVETNVSYALALCVLSYCLSDLRLSRLG